MMMLSPFYQVMENIRQHHSHHPATAAAELLGIKPTTFLSRIKKMGIVEGT